MNKIYRVVWNHALMMWTVVSELGKAKTKGTSSKVTCLGKKGHSKFVIGVLLIGIGNAHAFDINGYTQFQSPISITDGLHWKSSSTVQVDQNANVTVTDPSSTSTLNMSYLPSSATSMWINGGSLTATNNGSLLFGTNSMVQVGGTQIGGLSSQQSGGLAGSLSVGDIKTVTGATNATLWMFGSATQTSKLNATSIDLEADKNEILIIKANNTELGNDVNVAGNMTVINKTNGTFTLTGNSQLNVGGDLYLDTTNGSFLVTNDSQTRGIKVNGNLTLTNNTVLSSNINDVTIQSGIYSAVVDVGGDINLIGKNVGGTGLQLMNGAAAGISTKGNFNISSTVSGNTTTAIFGHGTVLSASNNINLNSVSGGAINLYIGDPAYGAPKTITANSIAMSGAGTNRVIFNNNQTAQAGIGGYIFNVPINGTGAVVQQTGHTTLSTASAYTGGTTISGGLLSIANNKALGSGSVTINSSPSVTNNGLDIAYTDGSDFSNILTGSGDTTVSGNARIVGDNSLYSGNWNVTGIARTDSNASSTNSGFGTGIVNVASGGKFAADTNGAFVFANALTGTGTVEATNNGGTFDFSSAVGNAFAGDVVLKNNQFSLAGDNTTALTNATLHVDQNNLTTVGAGTQSIGGLAFNGGTMMFGSQTVGTTTSANLVQTTKSLDLTGSGQVQISVNNQFVNAHSAPNTAVPLLQQDEDGAMVKLVENTGSIKASGGNLTLIDASGNTISDGVQIGITQNSENVATGTYDFRLTSGTSADGLYINYGLTKVALLTQGSNALILDAGTNTGNAADLSAQVTGSGDLRINTQNNVSLSNSSNSYTGATWVDAGGLTMNNNNVLGQTRLLSLANGTNFNMNSYTQILQNLSTDTGSTVDFNQGSLIVNNGNVAGNMTGAGSLTVTGGTLTIQSDNPLMTADTTIASDGRLRLLSSQSLGTGSVTNSGTLYLGQDLNSNISPSSSGATQYQTGALTNSGTIVIGHNDASGNAVAGTTLLVNGNYIGNGGHLKFNTVLADDNSLSDKLVVQGDTSGTTGISVTNAGGKGDKALNGIELISVSGDSSGEFTQEGRIVGGAYDYTLVRGTASNQNNWYLVNNGIASVPSPVPDLRPEAGSYIANLKAVNTLLNTSLHDRLGETQYIDALTGEKKVTSLWVRQSGNHNNSRDSSDQLKTQSNSYVAQIGGDVAQWSSNEHNRIHLGLMGGYVNSHNKTNSTMTNYHSKGSVDGYSAGIYATWYADEADKAGMYVDSWLQYGWFNNHINGEQLGTETYKSKGLTGSIETGYTFNMAEFAGSKNSINGLFVQLQAQATWMGVKNDDHKESNGTIIGRDGNGNVQTRLGLRTYLQSRSAIDNKIDSHFQPFLEVNWIRNTRDFAVSMDGTRVSEAGARDIGEVKVGMENKLNTRLNLWGNISAQMGSKGYNNAGAMVGVKYNF